MAEVTEEELLRAIYAEPDEVGPRLVYSDWLQQRGDALGEFIARAISDPAVIETDASFGLPMWRQRFQLASTFDRGMLSTLVLRPEEIDHRLSERLRGSCIRQLHVPSAHDLDDVIAALGQMAVRCLVLTDVSPENLRALLAQSPHLEELMFHAQTTAEHLRVIVDARLPKLRNLEPGYYLDDACAPLLASVGALDRLGLRYTSVTGEGLATILAGHRKLHALSLEQTAAGDAGVRAIADTQTRLEILTLEGAKYTSAALTVIANSPAFRNLKHLTMASNSRSGVDPSTLEQLITLPRGMRLDVDGMALDLEPRLSAEGVWEWTKPAGALAERFEITVWEPPWDEDDREEWRARDPTRRA